MKANIATVKPLKSAFLSIGKDFEQLFKILFVNSQPYSDEIKRLLVINTKDCLDKNNDYYNQVVKNFSVSKLVEEGYIVFDLEIIHPEHEEIKSYITLQIEQCTPNVSNPYFMDAEFAFNILTHYNYKYLGDFESRPWVIAGYIKGLLEGVRLSGLGKLEFQTATELSVGTAYSGVRLSYKTIHGTDDTIPVENA